MDTSTILNEKTRSRVEDVLGYLDFFSDAAGPTTPVQVIDTDWDRPATGVGRHGGFPHRLPNARWPRHVLDAELGDDPTDRPDDDRMAHVVTFEAASLTVPGVPKGAHSVSLFTPSLSMPGEPAITGIFSQEGELAEDGGDLPPALRENRFTSPCGLQLLPAIEIPLVVFVVGVIDFAHYRELVDDHDEEMNRLPDEQSKDNYVQHRSSLGAYVQLVGAHRFTEDEFDAIREVQNTLRSIPYVGGRHLRIQQDWPTSWGELGDDGELVMQFGEELAGINCGDAGLVYVSGDAEGLTGDWDCA